MVDELTTPLRFSIATEHDVAALLVDTKNLLLRVGFCDTQLALVKTIMAELATNILKYGRRGWLSLEESLRLDQRGIAIKAVDVGPGIDDIESALIDGFSTQGTLGIGLPSVRRMSDEFDIESGDRGTTVKVTIWVWD